MKSKSKNKNSKGAALAIFNFPYFRNENGSFDKCCFGIFIARVLLACLLSVFGSCLISELLVYSVSADMVFCSLFFCVLYYCLLSFKRKKHILIGTGIVLVLILLVLKDSYEGVFLFLSDAAEKIVQDGYLHSLPDEQMSGMFIVAGAVFGTVCAFCSVGRYRWFFPAFIAAMAAIPSATKGYLHFSLSLLAFVSVIIGMEAVNGSYSAKIRLAAGTLEDIRTSDRRYRRENKRRKGVSKLKDDIKHFGQYTSQSVTAAVAVFLCGSIIASTFPTDGSLKFDQVREGFFSLCDNVSDWLYDNFGGLGFGNSPYNGFFSADGGKLNISSSLIHEEDEKENEAVAEVYTSTADKMYLRGDVGYEFDGNDWRSISDLDYKNIKYETEDPDGGEVDMNTVLSAYTPEIQYYLMYKASADRYYDKLMYLLPRTVKVNYVKRINTLLMGGTPYILTFRENKYFSVYGDFTAVADKGSVKSMETAVLYQNELEKVRLAQLAAQSDSYQNEQAYWDSSIPTDVYDYRRYIPIYRQFVYDYYTSVPQREKECIDDFISEFLEYEGYGIDISTEQTVSAEAPGIYQFPLLRDSSGEQLSLSRDVYSDFALPLPDMGQVAADMEEYLASGKDYTYSLTADNFSDGSYVNNFLTKTKEGHCALFATVMCLAMREMGIPARYVTGFTVGGRSQTGDENNPFKYPITRKDLHAWVEVYFDGLGWIAYDPTPPDGRPESYKPTTSATEEIPAETTTTSATSATTPRETSETTSTTTSATSASSLTPAQSSGPSQQESGVDPETVKIILIVLGAAVVIFLIVMSVVGALRLLNKKEKQRMSFYRSGRAELAVAEMLPFTLELLKLNGVDRRSGESPLEYAQRADGTLKGGFTLTDIMPLFERAEFDKEPVFDEEERKAVFQYVRALYNGTANKRNAVQRLAMRIKLFGKTKNERKAKK